MKKVPKLFSQVILLARPELGPWQVTQTVGGKTIFSPCKVTIEQEDDVLPGLKVVYLNEIEPYRGPSS